MSANAKLSGQLENLPLSWRQGMSLHRQEGGLVVARFFGAELTSVFQPVVEPVSGKRVGYEAFVRCHARGDAALSPWSLFSLVADDETLVELDRLCRILHVLNDPRAHEGELLFLNVHGRLLAAVSEDHGRFFHRVLQALGKRPCSIVIETPESACREPDLLSFVFTNYRLNGFQVAANVTSVEEAGVVLDRVRPEFMKADARHVSTAPARTALHARVRGQGGTRLLFTRVASVGEVLALRALPDVLVQGYALGGPVPPSLAEHGGLLMAG